MSNAPPTPDPTPHAAIELAVLDAPVLASGRLTSFLLHLADAGAFDPVWSDQIHAGWIQDLRRTHPHLPAEAAQQRRAALDRAFPVANVAPSRDVLEEVLSHCTTPAERKSAHVLAVALSARAAVIVTDERFCLRDVMAKIWHDTAVLTPDAWCQELLARHPAAVAAGAAADRAAVGAPDLWAEALRQAGLTRTAAALA